MGEQLFNSVLFILPATFLEYVIPAKAGIQNPIHYQKPTLDSRFRGNDNLALLAFPNS